MTIPCTLVVPGNRRRAAPVYGLTECYHVTVCIDQPVAADVITPSPELKAGNAGGGGQADNHDTVISNINKDITKGLPPAAPPRADSDIPPAVRIDEKEGDDDKEEEGELDVEPIDVDDMPGLGPGIGPAWSAGFGTKHLLRRLRGAGGGAETHTDTDTVTQTKKRALSEADVDRLFGVHEKDYVIDGQGEMMVGEGGEEEYEAPADQWYFRNQQFAGQMIDQGPAVGGSVENVDVYTGVVSPKPKDTAAVNAVGATDAPGGGAGQGESPADGSGNGDGDTETGDDGSSVSEEDPPPKAPTPAPAPAPAPAPGTVTNPPKGGAVPDVGDFEPQVDPYVGGVAEIAVVRLCSREVVCQECGPVNVVPRCTCSLVLYDPLTDPDYFLK